MPVKTKIGKNMHALATSFTAAEANTWMLFFVNLGRSQIPPTSFGEWQEGQTETRYHEKLRLLQLLYRSMRKYQDLVCFSVILPSEKDTECSQADRFISKGMTRFQFEWKHSALKLQL